MAKKINEAGEAFGEAAVHYQDGESTLAEFEASFNSFVAEVQEYIREISEFSPPPEAEEIHQEIMGGLAKCEQAIDLMDEWFDTQDDGTKEATAILISECLNDVAAVEDELRALISVN